jgi:nucleobase:cation symporter-1, NCS1 family
MVLGAMIGLAAPKMSLIAGLATLTHGIAPLVLVVFSVGVATANAMNLYCGALLALTVGQTLVPAWSPGAAARTITSLVLVALSLAGALLTKSAFLADYTDFILLMLCVLERANAWRAKNKPAQ